MAKRKFFLTNIRFNRFMVNQEKGAPFLKTLSKLGMSYLTISWGANFADFDHDGDLDLFVANGDLNPNCTPMGNFYFENDNGQFNEKGSVVGLRDPGIGRGSIIFDMDNDGDMDILVINQQPVLEYPVPSTTRLYRNDLAKGNWLKVSLKGNHSESGGLGSRVEVVTGDTRMIREIDGGGSSHLSQNSSIVHFGLGDASIVDSVIVKWTGGKMQVLHSQNVNMLLTIIQEEERESSWRVAIIGLPVFLALVIGISLMTRKKRKRAKQNNS